MIGYFVWNPPREAFVIPFLNFPVYWYSLWFALGFYGAVVIARSLVRSRALALEGAQGIDFLAIDRYIERLALYSFFGVLIGARLGHILFYDALHYLHHPIDILNFRQGGLSSHGGVAGLCLSLWWVQRRKNLPPYLPRGADLLDLIAISSSWTAGCIRIGNFFNQEIVGTITSLPWAVVFLSPLDAEGGVPRHPTQLYEAAVSFLLLIPLLIIGRHGLFATDGRIAGWYLIITFSFRCLLEIFKAPQCTFDTGVFHMGQVLSLPVILFGIALLVRANFRKKL
jgi:phosphatidylglycerol---prolipoprotein diacylglyceryl transferase